MGLSQKKTKPAKEPGQRRLSTLLALDFASSGVKAVRLKKVKDQIVLSGVDVLDPVDLSSGECPVLPKTLAAYYTALCGSVQNAQLRVFACSLKKDEELAAAVRENLSVSANYRAAGRVLTEGTAKRPGSILGVAVPEDVVAQYLDLFASGSPAPHSLEISGLAAFSAFMFTCGKQTAARTVCLVETGQRYTYAAFFHKNVLQVINRFDIGGSDLNRQVQSALGVDAEMASAILQDGSVDVAAPVRAALAPLIKQLSIYREYVERQTKSVLSGIYLSGGEAASLHWQGALEDVFGMTAEVWNPFEGLEIPADLFPDALKGQEPRFAAAVGAALAGLEAL
jgi:hypothetical protein